MAVTSATLAQRRFDGWFNAAALALAMLAATVASLAIVGAVTDDDATRVTTERTGGVPAVADEGDDPAVAGAGADADAHAHSHGELDVLYADLPAATQAEVDTIREIARRYPTAADGIAGGYQKATISLKGIGAHYLKGGIAGFATIDGVYDIDDPEILLYDGEGPDAPLAGISYLVAGADPEGLTGDFDVWHRHNGVCLKDNIVISEIDGAAGSQISMTDQQCTAAGGASFPIGNLTMLHVWVGEGYEDGVPTFAHDHPLLYD
jgi:hypothetical protein